MTGTFFKRVTVTLVSVHMIGVNETSGIKQSAHAWRSMLRKMENLLLDFFFFSRLKPTKGARSCGVSFKNYLCCQRSPLQTTLAICFSYQMVTWQRKKLHLISFARIANVTDCLRLGWGRWWAIVLFVLWGGWNDFIVQIIWTVDMQTRLRATNERI